MNYSFDKEPEGSVSLTMKSSVKSRPCVGLYFTVEMGLFHRTICIFNGENCLFHGTVLTYIEKPDSIKKEVKRHRSSLVRTVPCPHLHGPVLPASFSLCQQDLRPLQQLKKRKGLLNIFPWKRAQTEMNKRCISNQWCFYAFQWHKVPGRA